MPESKDKKKRGPGKPFVKGDPRAGRKKLPPELANLKRLDKTEVALKLTQYLRMNINELAEVIKDHSMPAMDHWLCRLVLKGIKEGDQIRLNFIFDRLIGKVRQDVKWEADVRFWTNSDLIRMAPQAIEYLQSMEGDQSQTTSPKNVTPKKESP